MYLERTTYEAEFGDFDGMAPKGFTYYLNVGEIFNWGLLSARQNANSHLMLFHTKKERDKQYKARKNDYRFKLRNRLIVLRSKGRNYLYRID